MLSENSWVSRTILSSFHPSFSFRFTNCMSEEQVLVWSFRLFFYLFFFSPMGRVAWICKCWDGKVGQFGKSSNLKSRYHFSKFPVATGYEKLWFVCRFYFVDRYTQSFEIQLTKFPGNETEQTIILKIWFAEYNIRSPFLGSPGNLTGPKPYFKIKI